MCSLCAELEQASWEWGCEGGLSFHCRQQKLWTIKVSTAESPGFDCSLAAGLLRKLLDITHITGMNKSMSAPRWKPAKETEALKE